MIKTLSFRTQARTVDHLGREQIADCPTAISELWKNAYDAYARSVALHIFDDQEPVAAIFDDGHGMNYDEFIDRWFVVGTESKYSQGSDNEADRDGLSKRTKQGQKGIGRLSSANLGPLLLLVSKRKDSDFVAALIDWRIFENPFLTLSDIELPVTEVGSIEDLFKTINELFERLTDNIWGTPGNPSRTERIKTAWEMYDQLSLKEDPDKIKPSEAIANTIINTRFESRHFEQWSVSTGGSKKGTALLVSDINYDLRAQLPSMNMNGDVENIRAAFLTTLSAFTDPYVDDFANENNTFDPNFSYEVRVWSRQVNKAIVKENREVISRDITDSMEHVISGNVDKDGIFRGQIKAFGEVRQIGSDYVIYPPKDFEPPKGPTTFVGPFAIYIATYERERMNSTHSDLEFAKFYNMPPEVTGFLIFRNGLRVLPYGRIDNDFFEIEAKRSISAGREYWNARRMFGRISLSREQNPNLRDKAGREGFIDNRSAKALKVIVQNILKQSAYEYFGSNAELRQEVLPDIREQNQKTRAEQQRKELAKKNAKSFRNKLKRNLPEIENLYKNVKNRLFDLDINSENELIGTQELINDIDEKLTELRIVGAPAKLGSNEEAYRSFRSLFVETQRMLKELTEFRASAIERIQPSSPDKIAERQLQSLAARLQARLRNWRKNINQIQDSERVRVEKLFDEKNKEIYVLTRPLLEQIKSGRLELDTALESMQEIHERLDAENEDIFQAYLDTIEVLSENINIELIARQGTVDNIALRDEINTLNQVAQLGITVEILAHELHTNEKMIKAGLNKVRAGQKSDGSSLIETGLEALTQQLEFLSPLKVSGTLSRRKVTGKEIFDYLKSFFSIVISSRELSLDTDEAFLSLEIIEQPSRLLPIFVNLVNNSIYWLVTSQTKNPLVKLVVIDEKVVVADNGPGIDPVDQESLFKMFFTRKLSGGRGIGLYLCRMNLMAGGHSIMYAEERKFEHLEGANFVIDFKGATFG